MSKQTIGEQVKAFRLDRGLSQRKMADFLGLSVGTVVRLEHGEKCYDVTRVQILKKLKGEVAA